MTAGFATVQTPKAGSVARTAFERKIETVIRRAPILTMTWGGVGAGMLVCDKSSVVLWSPAWLGLGGRLPTRVAILCSASNPNRSTMLETIVGPRINQTLKARTSTIVNKMMPWTWPGRKLIFSTPRFRVEAYLTQAIFNAVPRIASFEEADRDP